MKLLVLGDSHTAAVKFGWDDIKESHPDVDIDFFALPVERIRHLRTKNQQITLAEKASPGNQALFNEIFPAGFVAPMDYDAIFLVGLVQQIHGLILSNAQTLLPSQVHSGKTGFLRKLGGGGGVPAGKAVGTRAMFEASWDDTFQNSKAGVLTRRMKKLHMPRCFLAINPLVSAKAQLFPNAIGHAYRAMIKQKTVPVFCDIAAAGLARVLPDKIELIAQPAETVVSGCMTDNAYMSGAEKYHGDGDKFNRSDILHANRAYGSLLLNALFARMGQPEVTHP